MFCPRCSAQNEKEQSYCRQCGLPLQAVRQALDGHAERALAAYEKGGQSLTAGMTTLVVCILIALVNFFLSSGARNYGMLVNLALGLAVGVPLLVGGMVRVAKAERLLKEARGMTVGEGGKEVGAISAAAPGLEGQGLERAVAESVTEEATIKLRR